MFCFGLIFKTAIINSFIHILMFFVLVSDWDFRVIEKLKILGLANVILKEIF